MRNITDVLVNLAAKITGAEAASIPQENKCDPLEYLAEHYEGMTGSKSAVSPIAETSTAEASAIAEKVNEIITQLKARGIVS